MQGDLDPTEVADILAEGEGTVDVVLGSRRRPEAVVLGDQSRSLLLEARAVLRRPPVVQGTAAVVA